MTTVKLRTGVVAAIVVLMLSTSSGIASAHVTVTAPGVAAGQSDAQITFRVPDESATAKTVGVKVQLPIDHPLLGVLVAPLTGWTAKIITAKLAAPIQTDDGTVTEVVSEIDWTADPGGGIGPGFFGQFSIIAGKLPDGVAVVRFKAIQTYSDKTVVPWIEIAAPSSTVEPEHPAPELTLQPSTKSDSPATSSPPPATAVAGNGTATATAAPATAAPAAVPAVTVTAAPADGAQASAATKSSVTLATIIGFVGILVGLVGVGLAAASRRRPSV